MESITNGKKRKRVRAETWLKLSIKPDEVKETPKDVVTQLTEENEDLRKTIDKKRKHRSRSRKHPANKKPGML